MEFVCESKEAEKNRDRDQELISKSFEDYAAAVEPRNDTDTEIER